MPLPFVPGSEYAGVVTSIGDGVSGAAVGHVFGRDVRCLRRTGSRYPASVHWIPAAIALGAAAAFCGARHGYHCIRSTAAVAPGEWVVVLGCRRCRPGRRRSLPFAAPGDRCRLDRREARTMPPAPSTPLPLPPTCGARALAPQGVDGVLDPVGGPRRAGPALCAGRAPSRSALLRRIRIR